jgi:nitrogen regulatory protein P-II 2
VAERILARVAEEYFAHYAVIAWVEDVEVVRGDKYA